MRNALAVICLVFAMQGTAAFAEERASLTVDQALSLCDNWLEGGSSARELQLPGWRRMVSNGTDVILVPIPPSTGEMRELQLFTFDYPTVEIRACSFTWRFNESAGYLNNAARALVDRGYEAQINQSAAGEGTAVASRAGDDLAVARVAMAVVPCRDIVIGSLRKTARQRPYRNSVFMFR